MRLFVAIPIPFDVGLDALRLQSGVPGAKWRPQANFHITLAFVGEVGGQERQELTLALAAVRAPRFSIRLEGVGAFGGVKPHTLWLGAEGGPALQDLHHRVESACRRAGLRTDARKYVPHMTLAYLKGTTDVDVAAFAARHGGFRSREFAVEGFNLYSAHPGDGANLYRVEHAYRLDGGAGFEELEDGFF